MASRALSVNRFLMLDFVSASPLSAFRRAAQRVTYHYGKVIPDS